MAKYDINWLKEKGFFETTTNLKIGDKDIVVDKKNLLAYTEVYNNEEVEKIIKELSHYAKIKYIWFYFPFEEKTSGGDKLKVFRRYGGELHWFWYKPELRREFLKSREDKLSEFSAKNIDILFDTRDIAERFYWQLWEVRIKLARSIKDLEEDGNKLLVVQHLIDRLIFFYFLAQLGLVRIKNKEKDWKLDRKRTREFFKWICDTLSEKDLQDFLNKIFFDVLGKVEESGWSSEYFEIGNEKFFVTAPSLNGGLFAEEEFEGKREREIKINGIRELILEILNKYNWIIGEEVPEEEDVIGELTPEIIGHIYEKFVVSLEELGKRLKKINLNDIKTVKGKLRAGRKKIGSYYTPEEITNYISMNTIYPYIKDRLKDKFGRTGEKIISDLFEKNNFDKKELEIIKYLYLEILTKIKICDNACGSGSFLIAAGNVLLRLYSKILKILEDKLSEDKDVKEILKDLSKSPSRNYYIVRQIITNNLYGVDIMRGAVEIAKLRFWLWLISQIDPKEVEDKRIETLPNLDFNLMVGNSLIGFVDIEDVDFSKMLRESKKIKKALYEFKGFENLKVSNDTIAWLKDLVKRKQEFKTLPPEKAIKIKEGLEKELEKAREFLNEKFYELLKAKKINVSKEDFLKLKPFHWGFEFYEVFDLEKPKEERGFDIIIGNPPYINIRELTKYHNKSKDIFKLLYKSASGLYDILVVFVERSINLLKNSGNFCYILSNKFTVADYGKYIRKIILENTSLYLLSDVSTISVFRGVGSYPIIMAFSKKVPTTENKIRIEKVRDIKELGRNFRLVKQKDFLQEIDNLFVLGEANTKDIINTIEQDSKILKDFGVLHSGTTGFEYQNWGKLIRDESSKQSTKYCKFIITGNIERYNIDERKKVRYQGKSLQKPILIFDKQITEGKWRLFNSKKIVIRGMAKKLTAALDNIGYALGVSVYAITDLNVNPKIILCIINSKLIDFYYKEKFISKHLAGGYIGYNKGQLEQIPIKLPEDQQPFIRLCDYMLFLNETEERRKSEKEIIEFIDRQIIDCLVYELYLKEKFEKDGLKTNLLQLVEPYLKDIENLKSDEEKLKTIKQVVEKIKSDSKIMKEIEKIKNHKWVRIIEGKER